MRWIVMLTLTLLLGQAVRAQEVKPSTWSPRMETGGITDYRAAAADSLRLHVDPVFTVPDETREVPVVRGGYDITSSRQNGGVFRLWKGAALGVYGSTDHMPGLLDLNTGSLALHQDFGRLHMTFSANANKYWMPMQSMLTTQYGFSGHVSYDVNEWMVLHAFGNYYLGDLRMPPAISPYAYSTSYGGYADVRFGEHWGANLGAQRYLNPMNGRWETDPIVTPYYKFNNGAKLELPLGHLLKEIIWGSPNDGPIMMPPMPPRP